MLYKGITNRKQALRIYKVLFRRFYSHEKIHPDILNGSARMICREIKLLLDKYEPQED